MKFNFFKWEVQVTTKPANRYRVSYYVPELQPGVIHNEWFKGKRAAMHNAVLRLDEYAFDTNYTEFFAEVMDEWTGKQITRIFATVHTEVINKQVHFEEVKA